MSLANLRAPLGLPYLGFLMAFAAMTSPAHAQLGTLEGWVVAEESGEPLIGVTLRLGGEAGGALTGEGGFATIRDIPSGRYTVTASHPSYASTTTEIAIAAGEATELRIEMSIEAVALSGITVVGRRGYYSTPVANTATRSLAPISQTPVAVQVVTRQVLDDQGAVRIEDAYRNVSGVTVSGNTLNASSIVQPYIRGFPADHFLRNGQRTPISSMGAIDLVNVESVEVLKGPASILFGALEPGGVVNYILRSPSAIRWHTVRQEIGSYDFYRTVVNSTGPLTSSGSVLYAFGGAYTDAGSFREGISRSRIALAPSVTFRPSDRLELSADFSYSRENSPFDTGVPFDLSGNPVADRYTVFGDPSLEREMETQFGGASIRYDLTDDWRVRANATYFRAWTANEAIRHTSVQASEGEGDLVQRRFQAQDEVTNQLQVVADVGGTVRTGNMVHGLLAGIEAQRQRFEDSRYREGLASFQLGEAPPAFVRPDFALQPPNTGSTDWVAVYAQDQIALADDRVHLLLSARYDVVEQGAGGPEREDYKSFRDRKLTGRAGLLANLTSAISPFVSVSQSFNPQTPGVVDIDGDPLRPERGFQVEAGVKFTHEDRLSATIAAYRIRKDGVAFFDAETYDELGVITYLPDVDQASRGIEVDVTGEIMPGLNLIAAYAYTDAETVASPAEPEIGAALGGVPSYYGRFWLAYDFAPLSPLPGLGIGAGARYTGSRQPSFPSGPYFELDAYTIADAAIWYRFNLLDRGLELQVNVDNVLDEVYFARASNHAIVHPGTPRTVKASLAFEF